MEKRYKYVGPAHIRDKVAGQPPGRMVASVDDLESWLRQTQQKANRDGQIVVTFVVDEQGMLRIADRGTEHIACSGGRSVLSAGEMFFSQADHGWRVEDVTNQSTGFCPEPESWPAVATALDRVGIPHPGQFTLEVVFRRCLVCGERNIVKDGWFVCGLCGSDLPAAWNFDDKQERFST